MLVIADRSAFARATISYRESVADAMSGSNPSAFGLLPLKPVTHGLADGKRRRRNRDDYGVQVEPQATASSGLRSVGRENCF